MTLAIIGATVIDATGTAPIPDAVIVLADDGTIAAVGPSTEVSIPDGSEIVRAERRFIIPGMLDANVHLVLHCDPDILLRYDFGAYDELVIEAAQVSLKAGFTTVFDTWGPLEALRRVRDRINDGELIGSRIYCAGNIIGLGGPWSADFYPQGDTINPEVVAAINAHWTHGVGNELAWQSVEDVRVAVREYIATSGIDFVKYACSVHKDLAYLTFAPEVQRAIVEEAHAAGMTAQACTITPEALKVAIDAGVDLLQHGDLTGRHPMRVELSTRIAKERIPCVAFLTTDRFMDAVRSDPNSRLGDIFLGKEENDRALVGAGAMLMLGTDGGLYASNWKSSPVWGPFLSVPDWYGFLGTSHLAWVRAADQLGMAPMDILQALTRNIAEAYDRLPLIGTLEPGKRADLVILDGDPLADVANYGRIADVYKDGVRVDRERLPENPVLTNA